MSYIAMAIFTMGGIYLSYTIWAILSGKKALTSGRRIQKCPKVILYITVGISLLIPYIGIKDIIHISIDLTGSNGILVTEGIVLSKYNAVKWLPGGSTLLLYISINDMQLKVSLCPNIIIGWKYRIEYGKLSKWVIKIEDAPPPKR